MFIYLNRMCTQSIHKTNIKRIKLRRCQKGEHKTKGEKSKKEKEGKRMIFFRLM